MKATPGTTATGSTTRRRRTGSGPAGTRAPPSVRRRLHLQADASSEIPAAFRARNHPLKVGISARVLHFPRIGGLLTGPLAMSEGALEIK